MVGVVVAAVVAAVVVVVARGWGAGQRKKDRTFGAKADTAEGAEKVL